VAVGGPSGGYWVLRCESLACMTVEDDGSL
jgi:hypothetical protein